MAKLGRPPRRFVAQEWSHEGTLQAMVEKAEKDDRLRKEASLPPCC